jgi:hypothetical protein
MDRAGTAAAPRAPWSLRLFDRLSLPPLWVGVAIAVALLALYFGVEATTGQIARVLAGEAAAHIPMHFRTTSTNILLLAYLFTAPVYLAGWTRSHVREIEASFALAPSFAAGGSRISPASRAAGVAGVLLLVLVFLVIPAQDISQYLTGEYWIFEHVWENLMILPIGWLGGRFAHALVSDALRVSRLAARIRDLDLLDLEPLQPFVRQGLRSALLVVIFVAIGLGHVGNVLLSPGGLAATFGAMGATALAALLVPARGAHRRIVDAKRAALRRLREAIRAHQRALLAGGAGSDRAARDLPALLALERRIDEVREWPFDAPSLARFSFYLLIGLGSWLGAAAVERRLDAALG